MQIFKDKISKKLAKLTKLDKSSINTLLEVPPDPKLGDYAFPCFALSKTQKKNPNEISEDLAKKFEVDKIIRKVEVNGPYVNFFIGSKELSKYVLKEVLTKKEDFGLGSAKKEKIMVEYVGPNTNKSLHLGHVRNAAIGVSLGKILKFNGFKVILVNINNDRGMGLCEAMLGYKLFHDGEEPKEKSDHFVANCYVEFKNAVKDDPSLKQKAANLLVKWESNDKETKELWSKITGWVLKGYQDTYKKLGVIYDKEYFESNVYKKGSRIVDEGLKKGIFQIEEGAVMAKLEQFGIPDKILRKSDGTSVYMTQDLYLAEQRQKDFGTDRMIYIVANEHNLHFRQLFKIFELLKRPWASKCHHLNYGLIHLPEGRMKSREGTVIDADNLIEETRQLAENELKKRHSDLNPDDLQQRSEIIGDAAWRFFILKIDPYRDMLFNPKQSVSFEGETGPYLQYAHARICSILRKSEQKIITKFDYSLLQNESEHNLIKQLGNFPEIITQAASHYKPSLICRYLLDLAQMFNEFYHKHKVLGENQELSKARLALVDSTRQVLENGLTLLGIEAPERM